MARYDILSEYNWLMAEILKHETEQSMALGQLLLDKLKPNYVVDIGCGPGIYLSPFKRAGCTVLGVDGANGAGALLNQDEFLLMDFRKIRPVLFNFDLALCIEVAEHVPQEYAANLMDIVCSSSRRDVFFCAAHPGQGGEGHYNEQHQDYWKSKFFERGFELHPLHEAIHQAIMEGREYEHCGWLRWNSFLMTREI